MPREQVEQTLADMGISTVSDKIPALMDHYLGFELITSNEENTRAAGILGFRVGQELLYIPVLFLNGKVKGTEVLYLKNSDVFTSCTKQWVEYLTTRAPGVMGEPKDLPPGLPVQPTPTTLRPFYMPPMIGGKIANDLSMYPDIDQMPGWKNNRVWNKTGSVLPDCGYDILNRLMKTAMRDQVCKIASRQDFTLPAVLQKLGAATYTGFMKWLLGQPALFQKLSEFYPMDELKLNFEPVQKEAAAPVEQKLARCGLDDLYANPDRFTTEEKTLLMSDGYLIFDKRAEEEKSLTYSEDYLTRFDAPHTNGFYEIVNEYGSLEKVFISKGPFLVSQPKASYHGYLIIDVESGVFTTRASRRHSDDLMVRSRHNVDESIWKEKFGKLPALSSVTPGKTYILVGPDLKTSAPFIIENKSGSGKDIDLVVRTPYEYRADMTEDLSGSLWDGDTILKIVDQDAIQIQRVGNIVFAPKDWKVLELDRDSDRYNYSGEQSKREILRRITPGKAGTITAAIIHKGIFKLTTTKDASDYFTFSEGKNNCTPSMKLADARWFLVSRAGLSVKDADECLNLKLGSKDTFIKLSQRYGPIFGGDPLPPVDNQIGMNNSGVMETQPQETLQTINMSDPEIPNSDGWNPDDSNWDKIKPQHIDFLMRAANSGSQQVFDPAMIGMILRTTRPSAQVEEWLPDLVNGLDIKCRLLLLFYWQNNEFSEDYGKDELAEFEDQLLNNIKVEGTVILFLKQKGSESPNMKIDAFSDGV